MKFDIHDKTENERERYVLGTSGRPKLFVLGVNPSTASKDKSDNTLTKVENFSRQLEFRGFVMLNIYPQRATNPKALHLASSESLIAGNKQVICSQIREEHQPQIWAAWGDLICSRDYLWGCLKELAHELKQFNPVWTHCGKPTKSGHPRHPSRLAYKEKFFIFDIFEYLSERRIEGNETI